MRNVVAIVEYDGILFHGMQVQPGLRTVQGELEQALFLVTQERIRIAAAGRTDAGVHASGQVVSFKTQSYLPATTLLRALNAALPDDIVVKHCADVAAEFHARFSAQSREYRYTILNREAPTALARSFVHHYRKLLNLEEMQKASESLIGTHDFASFARIDPDVSNTIRTVFRAEWCRDGSLIHFDIVANAFLPQMVRGLVGTLIWVGTGKIDACRFQDIMHARDRRLAGPTVPAKGLCFVKANY
ncbi:MAG: tRNA pseudouridine(38-40) synthase TruA [Chloroflexi bacterium]|nr:tRNA pseudouridine(38-40) synthase TruA [Chloroflexota bacterium]